MWETLSPPWQACLELAWEAYCDDSIPIGAVVTGADGVIIARGRNRIHDKRGADGRIYGNPLAHAEANALVTLDYHPIDPHTCILYTTTEPCPMCMGMFYMSGLRTLHYAYRDPFAGSVNLLGTTPYLSRKLIKVFDPPDPTLEILIMSLHVEMNLFEDARCAQSLHTVWRSVVAEGVRLGEALHRSGELRQMREMGLPAANVIEKLIGYIETHR